MYSIVITLLLLIAADLSNAEWNTKDYQRREHSLIKPYQGKLMLSLTTRPRLLILINYHILGSGLTMPFWDFMGSVIVSGNYVRLTPDLQSKSGALWNSVVSFITK